MRRWLLLVLVLLLPVRAWVGDAMAGDMLQQHLASAVTHEAHAQAAAEASQHSAAHDCDEHRQAAVEPAADEASAGPAHADCATCASCQACSSVALSPAPPAAAGSSIAHPQPRAVVLAYASAEPALAFKPPRR